MLTYRDFGVEPSPDFNLEAANAVYEVIMDMDDASALAFSEILAFDGLTSDIIANKGEIQEFVTKFYEEQAEAVNKSLARTYISKRASGDDTDSLIAAAESIRKAAGLVSKDFTDDERRLATDRQYRDNRGRWITMNRKIEYDTKLRQIGGHAAQRLGIPDPAIVANGALDKEGKPLGPVKSGLTKEQQKNFREAYLQVHDFLHREVGTVPPGESIVEMTFSNPAVSGSTKKTAFYADAKTLVNPKDFRAGNKLEHIAVRTPTDISVNGAAYGVVNSLAGHDAAAWQAEVGGRSGEQLKTFSGAWAENKGKAGTNERMYSRLQSGSNFATSLLPEGRFNKLRVALGAGNWIGQYGPEAEKVLGPTARKTAYRYRGVERTPEKGVVQLLENAPRDEMIYGKTKTEQTRGNGLKDVDYESPIVRYFTGRLPKEELYTLQRKSGTIPPSEGVILDNKGRVVTQAVGYGDDWYLPFNLRNVGKLNGGEYIRTRAIGGLTTEDIYTGLVSGARRVTVISRSGVFTMEFDDNFRGNRRYSDKAARMVHRYGALLDAVEGGGITPSDVSPDIEQEIYSRAHSMYDTAEGVDNYVKREKDKAKLNPKLSDAKKEEIKQQVIDEHAARYRTPDGHTMSGAELVQRSRGSMATNLVKENPRLTIEPETVKGMVDSKYGSTDAVINSLGLDEVVKEKTDQALRDYAASLKPLKLDGNGYNYAAQALREQFPYYIKDNVVWRNTPDIGGVAQGTKSKDFGYVKARFTRPEGAETGYFDESITGHGKITADRTNYQNLGVDTWRKGGTVSSPIKPTTDERKKDASTPGDAPRKNDAIEDAAALLALAKHMRSIDTDPETGKTITDGIMLKEFPILVGLTDDELMDRMEKTGFKESVRKEVEKAKKLNVDEDLANAYLNPEKLKKPSKDFDRTAALFQLDRDFNFEDVPSGKSPEQYTAIYEGNGRLETTARLLGASGIDDPKIIERVNTEIVKQRELWGENTKIIRENGEYRKDLRVIKDTEQFDQNLKDLVKLRQLARYHAHAVKNYKPEPAAGFTAQPLNLQVDLGQALQQAGFVPQTPPANKASIDNEFFSIMRDNGLSKRYKR